MVVRPVRLGMCCSEPMDVSGGEQLVSANPHLRVPRPPICLPVRSGAESTMSSRTA